MATATFTLPIARVGDNLITGWDAHGRLEHTPTAQVRFESDDQLLTPDQLQALRQTGATVNIPLKGGEVFGVVTSATTHRVTAEVSLDQLRAAGIDL